jgi:hypothetical protein
MKMIHVNLKSLKGGLRMKEIPKEGLEKRLETIFSKYTIQKKASEIANSDEINIELQSPGHVLIEIKCKSDKKYKEFESWINTNKPIGANVTLCRKF